MTHKKLGNSDEIVFTSENLLELISRLKQEEGKDIWICFMNEENKKMLS